MKFELEIHETVLKELSELFNEPNELTYHKGFIYKWVTDNKTEFCEQEDLEKLEKLLNLTAIYLSKKHANNFFKLMYGKNKSNRILTELKPRVTKHLQRAVDDLKSIFASCEKTKLAIETIKVLISEMDDIVPLRKSYSENVEEIRSYLKKQNFRETSIKEYIGYFKNPY